jgi:hypothetical protein
MAYFRSLLDDARRLLTPDLVLVAAAAALALVIPYYYRIRPPGIDPRFASAVQYTWRSIIYLALPLLTLPLLRMKPTQVGFTIGKPGQWLKDIALLYIVMLPLLYFASRQPGFQRAYPYFGFARLGPSYFFIGLAVRFIGMFAWEFILRGHLLFGFERRIGAAAIAVQMIPFVVMHQGKPALETYGSIVAGIVLGIIALRNRSFLPGVLLHWSVAATLDVFALLLP